MKKFPQKKYSDSNLFFKDYSRIKSEVLNKLDFKIISNICFLLEKVIRNKKNIFVCGNGGSASVANHFICDFNKGIKISSKNRVIPRVISLNLSNELLTAIGNDLSFSKIFSHQLDNYANIGDCLITLSCSGNSKNIIDAIKFAKKRKIKVVSLTGFYTKSLIKSDYHLDIGCKNYGICEDIFQSIMHMIAQFVRQKFEIKNL